ncbi:MAG: alpha/beta hydrolase [Ktedonobacterales bacterium]
MPLHPEAQAYLEQMKQFNVDYNTLTPAQGREMLKGMQAMRPAGEAVARVEDRTVPGPALPIPIRIYTPAGSGPFPVLVFLHTGAWMLGGLEMQDPLCRRITNRAGCIVVSVEYRLAPEYPFPAAVEDSFAATQWVAAHAAEFGGDPARVAIGGDSAGANMATVVAIMARDQGGPALVLQMMLFPATDFRLSTPSIEEFAATYNSVSKAEMIWIIKHYLPNSADITHPLASPMLAPDLSGLPPAFIMTAEYDGLRDDGELYGQRLRQAGIPARVSRYDGMIHDFLDLFEEPGNQGVNEIAAVLRSAFNLDGAKAEAPAGASVTLSPAVPPHGISSPLGFLRVLFGQKTGSKAKLAASVESGRQV